MVRRSTTNGTGWGVSFILSTVIHLAVFLLLMSWSGFLGPLPVPETYFVDVVNLPVASPRVGQAAHKGNSEPAPPPSPPQSTMTVPKVTQTAPIKNKALPTPKPSASDSEAESFAKKMARLESKTEAQQQEEALARLRNKVKTGTGRAGMPTGTGKEAGSDYTAYIQSRLKEAFRETISYSTKNPEVVMRLFIDVDGKLSRRKAERSSNDHAFEISVMRAIDLASDKFPPPPNHKSFEGVFVFKPQGITPNKP
ncbi:MAG TPA: energy transducer TonB [Desulfuromonadaceae bacterium]|jgi:colicin import membrane protein